MQKNSIRQNLQWLPFLRISIAIFCMLHFLSIQPDFINFFSYNGYIQPDIMSATQDSCTPTIFQVYSLLKNEGFSVTYDSVVLFFRIFYFVILACLGFGLFTRLSAILSLVCQLILIKSIHYFQYGADFFTTMLLFYCVIFPIGKVFSIDNLIFKRVSINSTKINYLRLLQVHICIAYFVSGVDKLTGINWQNGEALWKAVTSHNNLGLLKPELFAKPTLFIIGGWMTIIIEALYPVFINIPKTRKFWLFLTVCLHLSIVLFLGLFFFSTVMILFNLTAYYIPYLKESKETMQWKWPVIKSPFTLFHKKLKPVHHE